MSERARVLLGQVALGVVLGGAWELAGRLSAEAFFLVGSPSAVAISFWNLALHEDLLGHFLLTGSEAGLGLVVGTVAGSAIGLALWLSERSARVSRPFVLAAGSLPIFALAPLMIVWFGIGLKMKVALATFATIFLSLGQAQRGAAAVSKEYLELLRGMNASRAQVFWKVVVPGSLEWVLGSMRANVGLALLGAFIGEFIASDRGLGYLILKASGLYNVPRALAAAVGITVLALLFDRVGAEVEKRRDLFVRILSVPRLLWHRRHPRTKRGVNRTPG